MIVCADDYGLADDINAAILELCGSRRLSAVSCMVILERCSRAALEPLLALGESTDIGLHLCLTDEGLPVSGRLREAMPSFGPLLRQALRHALNQEKMERAVAEQYELFVSKTGRSPSFIDGHLHVHQLPGVRQALVRFLLSLPPGSRPYVRNTFLPLRELRRRRLPWTKAVFITAFGTRMLRLLRETGIWTNQGFSGIYDFRDSARYPEYLPRFVDCLPDRDGILVAHPGSGEPWRRQEAQALGNFRFPRGSPNRFTQRAGATSAIPCPQ